MIRYYSRWIVFVMIGNTSLHAAYEWSKYARNIGNILSWTFASRKYQCEGRGGGGLTDTAVVRV